MENVVLNSITILTGRIIFVYSPLAIAVSNSSLVTGLESRNLNSGKKYKTLYLKNKQILRTIKFNLYVIYLTLVN